MGRCSNVKDAANIALLVLAIMVAAFTLLYVIRSPWERNRVGRIYAAKSIVLALVLAQISVSSWVSLDYPGRQPIRLVIYTLGAIVYAPMLWALWREQQEDRRRHREEAKRDEV
ncbi:hypothetical protein GS935_20375 [Rhodococcus hoagii]|uniref:Holin n=1 Tax=Rhodococcus hoagii TaxID=43767 RepID=A0A9Q2PQD5_RHOHA|nr:hypothetical protein [Prescottella equi]MBM4567998.1 hypothetical protein [Prescottella equi]MBM4592223.1 hypothetical protein [Prescottella equi]NKT69680.1 hypothetical protein [Prescottella equi]NKT99832.1 hypothetical protein [Prescottella equi]